MNTISVEELEKIDSSKITIVDVRPADQYSRRKTVFSAMNDLGVCSLPYGGQEPGLCGEVE